MKNIHVLPTEKTSRLQLQMNGNLHIENGQSIALRSYQNIYITSDEKIKEGDWHISSDGWCIDKTSKEDLEVVNEKRNGYKKIILTTDQELIKDGVQAIDDEFLEWFVKNPSCVVVEVDDLREISNEFIELDTMPYKIIIPKEPKQENIMSNERILEEAAQRYSDDWENITGLDYEDEFPEAINKLDFINGAKWQQQQQQKRSYSEEDLMDFGAFIRIEDRKEKRLFLIQDYFKVWFNQFKKK